MSFPVNDDDIVLFDDLGCDDKEIGIAATDELRSRGDREVSRVLTGLTTALQNPTIRFKAIAALGSIADPRAVESLIPFLDDREWNIRGRAAVSLGQIKDPRAISYLVKLYEKESSDQTRGSAYQAIQAIGGDEADRIRKKFEARFIEKLKFIQDSDPAQSMELALAGVWFSDFYKALKQKFDEPSVINYLYEFARSKINSHRYTADPGSGRNSDLSDRIQAAKTIALMGDDRGGDLLLEFVKRFTNGYAELIPNEVIFPSKDGSVQLVPRDYEHAFFLAISSLGEIRKKSAVIILKPLLNLERAVYPTTAKYYIAEALWKIEGDIKYLLSVLMNDSSAEARKLSARLLGEIGDKKAFAALVAALNLKSKTGLHQYTTDSGPDFVRYEAAIALGKLKDQRAIAPLSAALKDKFSHTRLEAAKSLLQIPGAPVSELLTAALNAENDKLIKSKHILMLSSLGNENSLPALKNELQNPDVRIRIYAARAIKKIQGE